jgi:hypothetical protein
MSSAGPVFHPAQPQFLPRLQPGGQGFSNLQRQVIQCPNNLQAPTAGNQSVQRTQATQDTHKLTVGAITMVIRDITPIDAPTSTLVSVSLL